MDFQRQNLSNIPILSVAERLGIEVKRKGSAHMACCVWHNDRHPSMSLKEVSGGTDYCHCFSCGKGGDAVALVMAHLGCGFLEAVRWLDGNFPSAGLIADSQAPQKKKGNAHQTLLSATAARPRYSSSSGVSKEHFSDFGTAEDYWLHSPFSSVTSVVPPRGDRGGASSFYRCLAQVFGESLAKEAVDGYMLGHYPHRGYYDDVLFPSIDRRMRVLDFKVQSYDCDPRSDRFFHKTSNFWLGRTLHPDRTYRHDCLFGEHLLDLFASAPVALVESPKNAVVGWCYQPDYLWLAVGSRSMLNRQILSVLHERNVIVIPDEDAFEEWSAKISDMQDIATFQCIHPPGEGAKRDIADWILSRPLLSPKSPL